MVLRCTQGKRGHVETRTGVLGVDAKLQKLLPADPERRVAGLEVAVDELDREDIVPCGDGRMRGEDRCRSHPLQRLIKLHTPIDPLRDPPEQGKRRMAFIEVHREVISAEGMEHLPATDAEHDLLPEALFQVSGVEAGGYPPVFRNILDDIRIEEVERYPPHLDLPDGDMDGRVDVWNLDHQVFT